MVTLLFVLFQFWTVSVRAQSTSTETTTEFVFRGFKEHKSEIRLDGAATIEPNGILRLTDQKLNVTGTAFYHKPVRLLDTQRNSTNVTVRSFSASFFFVIIPSNSSNGGFGFTFTLSPTPNRPGAESEQYLGLLNRWNDGNIKNHVFAVEFDTVQGFRDGADRTGNHIGLNFNSLASNFQEPVVYYDFNDRDRKEDVHLQSGEPIQAILEYDGPTQMLHLTIYPNAVFAPRKPLISKKVPHLSEIVQEEMYVGFTAATGIYQSSFHYVLGWSFFTDGDHFAAARLHISDLPLPQLNKDNQESSDKDQALATKLLIVVGLIYRYAEVKRFTKSFACVVGRGGFGTVYKGNLPDGRKVAVKVLKDSKSNGEDFINEVASMSQTSHVNIVNLVGFCYEGSKRVIVYEFLENGSLDQFISTNTSSSAEWRRRLYEIALGVARGLEYLHYGCKTRIVHFDIKPQNVLLDDNLCPKVSDFGLAKLCEKK
ncbi:Lectin-domain containing receptor kinase VI.3 [Cardamine amara subsp. amara]|uniref:non-specific serine/threonine protein kinase n=1 Tax=Cardamine amara subsp. amara TaxID=228776 RepID=A0ABD0ZTT5_CARAN